MYNAGWHCSYRLSTREEMVGKIRSFSHTELDKEEFTDREKIVSRVRNGTDMFERKGEENKFDRVDDNTDVPWFVLERKEK
jgi:beta-1,4-mannosyl-glycoprotein beta-1,4-N-acetylglucosaminyltransferase